MEKEVLNFAGGLNTDIAPELLPEGDYTYALNCRNSDTEDGNIGVVENVRGMERVDVNLPAGTNEVLKTVKDIKNDNIIYFLYNSDNNHCILQYNIRSKNVEFILNSEPLLGFTLENYIHANVVSGLLLWTDGNKPPRCININKAYNYTNGTGSSVLDSYTEITEQILNAIPYAPNEEPDILYATDTSKDINNLKGKQWQFQYQFVYDNNEVSTFSPFSKIIIPQNEIGFDGLFNRNNHVNNYIKVYYNTGNETVYKINIAARNSNTGDTYLIDTIYKYDSQGNRNTDSAGDLIDDNNVRVYHFYNNKSSSGLSQDESRRLFSWLPRKATTQEVIGGNRVCYGNYLEGYNNIDINAEASYEAKPANLFTNIVDLELTNYIYSYSERISIIKIKFYIYLFKILTLPAEIPEVGSILEIQVKSPTGLDSVKSIKIEEADIPTYPNSIRTKIRSYITSLSYDPGDTNHKLSVKVNTDVDFGFLTDNQIAISYHEQIITEDSILGISIKTYGLSLLLVRVLPFLSVEKTFKEGAYHDFGIVYYDDANRSGGVNTGDSLSVYIPPRSATDILHYKSGINIQINHTPPEWAVKYQIVYTRNTSKQRFIQLTTRGIEVKDNYIEIDVNTGLQDMRDKYPNSILADYLWQKGDRIRLLEAYDVISSSGYDFVTVTENIDTEILSQDESTGKILVANESIPTGNPVLVVELYTPKKELQEKIFFEIGETYDILNPGTVNRLHAGNPQNQTSSQPAIIELDDGDSYFKLRNDGTYLFVVESEELSDYYESTSISTGRVNLQLNDFNDLIETDLFANIRHGGKIVENTQINDLFMFDYNNYISLSEKFGEINKLAEVGFTLKAIQKHKNNSIYIERTSSFNPDGSEDLILTDSVLGTIRIPEDNFGTVHPNSVVVHDRHMYFYDVYSGKVIRDSANGMIPISEYNMNTYFKNISKQIVSELSQYKIESEYDERYNEYILTFSGPTEETISFHERSNKWKSFYSFIPESYGKLGLELISFVNGELWRHNSTNNYNNYYGVSYPQILETYANNNSNRIKNYLSMAIHSNKKWSLANRGDIMTLPSETYPNGMESRLIEGKFTDKEGILYSEFLNDMGDPVFTNETEALLNGRELKGHVIKVRLENNHSEFVRIFLVDINSIISNYS